MRAGASILPALVLGLAAGLACGSVPQEVRTPPPVLPASAARPGEVLQGTASEVRRVPLRLGAEDRLRIEGFDGPIMVRASDPPEPHLVAFLRVVSIDRETAERALGETRVVETKDDGWRVLRLETALGGAPSVTRSTYELVVPAGLRVRVENEADVTLEGPLRYASVETTYGDVTVRGIRGPLGVVSRSGTLLAEDVQGEHADLQTNHGDVHLVAVEADTIEARSLSGNVELEATHGRTTHFGTTHGSLSMNGFAEDVRGRVPGGSVRLLSAPDVPLSLSCSQGYIGIDGARGDVVVRAANARVDVRGLVGTAEVRSRTGNVSLRGELSRVVVESGSGQVEVEAHRGSQVSAPWTLRSGYGNVRLSLPDDLDARLEARTLHGTVHSAFAHEIETVVGSDGLTEETGIRAHLGAGGERVRIVTESGKIEVVRGPH